MTDPIDVAVACRFIELAAAFGQGAGTAQLDSSAAQAIYNKYHPAIAGHPEYSSPSERLAAIEWARTFGRLAAAAANARGAAMIGQADLASVVNVDRSGDTSFGVCPYSLVLSPSSKK
jgi:hypothetical protein